MTKSDRMSPKRSALILAVSDSSGAICSVYCPKSIISLSSLTTSSVSLL